MSKLSKVNPLKFSIERMDEMLLDFDSILDKVSSLKQTISNLGWAQDQSQFSAKEKGQARFLLKE